MDTYFMSGKFYINQGGSKVLTGYFSTTTESVMGTSETFKQMFEAIVKEYDVHDKMVHVEQFNKV